jgi:hypothetical protein
MKVFLLTLALGLVSCASHHSVTSKQKMRHISPAPHLVHFSLEYKKELELTDEQIKFLENVEKDLHPQGMKFAKAIMQNEQKIKEQSLQKVSAKEMMETYSKVESSREGLAKLKVAAALKLKKQLSKKQWQALEKSYREKHDIDLANRMVMMRHVNPVPNYMKLIKMNQEIELTDDQQSKINQWQRKNHSAIMGYAKQVLKKEQSLSAAVFSGKSEKEIFSMLKSSLETRRKIVVKKTQCRDYVTGILSKEQWEQVTNR